MGSGGRLVNDGTLIIAIQHSTLLSGKSSITALGWAAWLVFIDLII
jgi:hypothetical protein